MLDSLVDVTRLTCGIELRGSGREAVPEVRRTAAYGEDARNQSKWRMRRATAATVNATVRQAEANARRARTQVAYKAKELLFKAERGGTPHALCLRNSQQANYSCPARSPTCCRSAPQNGDRCKRAHSPQTESHLHVAQVRVNLTS